MGLVGQTAGYGESGRLVESRHDNRNNEEPESAAKLLGRHGITLTVLGASLAGTFLAWLAARVAVDPVGFEVGRLTLGASIPPVSYPTFVLLGGRCISGMLALITFIGDRRRRDLELKVSSMARHLDSQSALSPRPEIDDISDRYALAVQAAQDGLWDWNLRTDRVDYSPRWKALIGF